MVSSHMAPVTSWRSEQTRLAPRGAAPDSGGSSTGRRAWSILAATVALVVVSACAAQRAEGPLGVTLGLSPDETAHALRAYDFCRRGEPAAAEEVFPQCDRPGAGFGQAWVVAHYRDGRLIRLARFERWTDELRAQERWNQLIEKRGLDTPPSQAARDQIFGRQRIPERTRSWIAFATADSLIGVYLLSPARADDPAILEEIIPVVAPPEP